MRNEEMDTRLQTWQSRCWSLKQINLEQQRLIKALHLERAEYLDYQKRCRKISENSVSFARFECQKLGQTIQHDQLFENTLDIQAKTLSDLKDMQANTERLRAVILNYDDRIHEVQDENLKLQAELSILISRQQEPSLEYRFKELKESSLRRL